jgi:uncharacterized protein
VTRAKAGPASRPRPERRPGGQSSAGIAFKPSAYNHRTALPDGDVLHFNFYTLNLISLPPRQAALADRVLRDPATIRGKKLSGLTKQLIDKGFLVDARIDETDLLRRQRQQARSRPGSLGMTILPTLACNFRCVYCYEAHRPQSMGPEVEAAVLGMAEDRLTAKGDLSVTWFGGEPLLRMDVIERLSSAFIDLCGRREARYTASMISNGFLLTRETAEKLSALQVARVQVTLDGPPGIHDARRPLAGGGGTFATILENLKAASEVLRINLRINVDHSNRASVPELLDLLVQEGLGSSVFPYLGQTRAYTEVCQDVAALCLTDEDFSLFELETGVEMIKRGLGGYSLPQSRSVYCMAERENHWVVAPWGGLMKCWNDASDPGQEVAHLLEPATARREENALRWRSRDPHELECRTCLLLPVCAGGCPYFFLRFNTLDCHGWKHHLDESLAFYYLIKQMERLGEIGRHFYEVVEEVKKLDITKTRAVKSRRA